MMQKSRFGHSQVWKGAVVDRRKFRGWTSKLLVSLAAALVSAKAAQASDWPQFLGPTRNGVYAGNDLAASWPKDGPLVIWQKKVGQGFSGPAVAAGKTGFFFFLRNTENRGSVCAPKSPAYFWL